MMIPTIVIAVAIVLVFLFAKQKKTTTLKKAPPVQQSSPYRAVAVSCDQNACEGAKAMSGKRFLISDTPLLPLLDCTASKCNCKYTHHPDRRGHEQDRRLPSSLKSSLFSDSGTAERRAKHGRRNSD